MASSIVSTIRGWITSIIRNWQPEPSVRGTYSVLSICISTYIICIWTATHIDILSRKCGFWRSLGRRLQGLRIGIITPTVFMGVAASQLYTAVRLSRDAHAFLNEPPPPLPVWSHRLVLYLRTPPASGDVLMHFIDHTTHTGAILSAASQRFCTTSGRAHAN